MWKSLAVSTQAKLEPKSQRVWPAAHPHRPPEHTAPDGHSCLQAPQLLASVLVSTQLPLQSVWPDPQLLTHWLLEHTSPEPQAWLQAPQLSWSLASETHTPLQLVFPVAQVVTQRPFEQT